MKTEYIEEIKETIRVLVSTREQLFERALNLAMKGPLEDIDEAFEIGDVYDFKLAHFDNTTDINLQKLVDLIKEVEKTADSIVNLNDLDYGDIIVE